MKGRLIISYFTLYLIRCKRVRERTNAKRRTNVTDVKNVAPIYKEKTFYANTVCFYFSMYIFVLFNCVISLEIFTRGHELVP